jgi:hypothetical protein
MYEFTKSRYGLGQDDDGPTSVKMQKTPVGTFQRIQTGLTGPSGLVQSCQCYKNSPREGVSTLSRPWTLEFDTGPGGDRFVCGCETVTTGCPESMRPVPYSPDYASKQKQCEEWKKAAREKKPEADRDIENEQFRLQLAQKMARAAGVPEWRINLIRPAEFLTVVEERSRRGQAVWIFSTITIAAGGGFLLWKYLRGRRGRKET